tara:strand:- start:682 stop:1143 length:462 start_codon:yes stop_codon:yes gene_type:complete
MSEITIRVIDAYVYRQTIDGFKFLLLKRAKTKMYEHLWQGVAGKIEKNETATDAAIRELKEETGFNPISMFVVDHISNFYEAHQDRINLVPVFGIEVDNEIVTLSKEHCEFKWLEFDLAYKMLVWRGQKEGISAVYNMLNSSDERIRWSKILL